MAGPDPREPYGRLVRETWVDWAREQPGPKPSWLTGWDDPDLDDGQREVDMRMGAAVVAAERERIRQLAVRSNAICVGDEGTNCYFADLIGEPQERSDEKEAEHG